MKRYNFLWALATLLFLSFLVSAFGSHTVHYQCKYVQGVEIKVSDHEKYASAVYAIHYSDGTTGVTNSLDTQGDLEGIKRGAACKTVLDFGWPYQATNRNVTDQSSVRE